MWWAVLLGFLDIEEIGYVCKELGRNLSAKKLTEAMDQMDKDGSGEVTLKEFERWWRRQLGARFAIFLIVISRVMHVSSLTSVLI